MSPLCDRDTVRFASSQALVELHLCRSRVSRNTPEVALDRGVTKTETKKQQALAEKPPLGFGASGVSKINEPGLKTLSISGKRRQCILRVRMGVV